MPFKLSDTPPVHLPSGSLLIRDDKGLWSYLVVGDRSSIHDTHPTKEERAKRLVILLNLTNNISTEKLQKWADKFLKK